MSLADRVREAQEIADTSIDPFDHRRKLALEAAQAAEDEQARRLIDPPPEISVGGIEPPPSPEVLIAKPPPPSSDLPASVPPPVGPDE